MNLDKSYNQNLQQIVGELSKLAQSVRETLCINQPLGFLPKPDELAKKLKIEREGSE